MTPILWDRKGVFMVEFMQQGTTVMSEVYCETQKELRRAVQNKRRGMLTFSVMLLHDNACQHTTVHTLALLEHFNWEMCHHPPYNSDLPLSNYHLFTYLKTWLKSQYFNNKEQLMERVNMWLSSQAANFFDIGIQKLIPRYDKCLSYRGDYVQK
jgi:hypothetical protein